MDGLIGILVLILFIGGYIAFQKWHAKKANREGGGAIAPDIDNDDNNSNQAN